MRQVTCLCGAPIKVFKKAYNRSATCIRCKRSLRFVVPRKTTLAQAAGTSPPLTFGPCLIVESGGGAAASQQFFLAEGEPITVGKLPQNPLCLSGPKVSRHHCTLEALRPGHWRVTDHSSLNGVFVNSERVGQRDLRDGDLLEIGEFSLRFHCPDEEAAFAYATALEAGVDEAEYELPRMGNEGTVYAAVLPAEEAPAELGPPAEVDDMVYDFSEPDPVRPRRPALRPEAPAASARTVLVEFCPSCKRKLGPRDKICVNCGIDLKTGKPLIISHAVDENVLYGNVETVARLTSFILRIMLMPVASDAYGKYKPFAMRVIAAVTIAVTVGVWIINANGGQGEFGSTRNLMLWTGDQPNPLLNLAASLHGGQLGEFHYYQFLTNIFLHAGIMHIAGNLVFFFVFANRINALLNQWKAAASYLLLGILASLMFYLSCVGKPLMPGLGASGAIMGMAGMYLVLMPLSSIYMVFWARLGIFTGFRRYTKIFRMRGIWMLLAWIALNDLLPTLLGSHDHTAHWAHLGGFICGMVLAMVLLLTRQVNANGGDILSVTLGPLAWKILGTPAERAAAA